MRGLKPLLWTVALVLFVRYGAVYYRTYELNQFIGEEIRRTASKELLHDRILRNAERHNFALAEDDISITQEGSVTSVELNYRVPVDYLVAKHVLAFHAAAAGSLQKATW